MFERRPLGAVGDEGVDDVAGRDVPRRRQEQRQFARDEGVGEDRARAAEGDVDEALLEGIIRVAEDVPFLFEVLKALREARDRVDGTAAGPTNDTYLRWMDGSSSAKERTTEALAYVDLWTLRQTRR